MILVILQWRLKTMKYEFTYTHFQRQVGKKCMCMVITEDDPDYEDWICPCATFRHEGECRCKLFIEVDE